MKLSRPHVRHSCLVRLARRARRAAALVVLAAPVPALAACAARPRPPPESVFVAEPATIPEQPPSELGGKAGVGTPARASLDDGPIVQLAPDAGAPALPISWRATFGQTRPFADAIRLARAARASFDASAGRVTSFADGGTPDARAFEEVRVLLERCNRAFAAAYHAPNASAGDQLDALREAAEMLFAWSRRLDDAGLAHAPATYRSDSAVALTFEDVAHGPVERWKQEGIALVELCAENARRVSLDTPAARGCGALRRSIASGRPTTSAGLPTGRAQDAGARANGCACAFGDPLCSASMSGWCHPD